MPESLKKLIKKCKNRDREAQEQLYKLFSGRFFILCLKYSSDCEQAKDNMQEGFIKIFQKIDQYKNKGTFEGWMTRIVINTCLKEYQNQPVFLSIEEEYFENPEVEIELNEVSLSFLIEIIQELPSRYRVVFNLYVMEGFGHKEIAEMLKISEGTSKSNLSRARIKLKERIESQQKAKLAP